MTQALPKTRPHFPTFATGVWYTGAVNWAVANGVMNGYADETGARTAFGPDDAVTMEQLLQTLANLKGASNADEAALSSLIDAENISPWARSAAAWAIQQGVVSGYELSDGTHQLVPGRTHRARTRCRGALECAREGHFVGIYGKKSVRGWRAAKPVPRHARSSTAAIRPEAWCCRCSNT